MSDETIRRLHQLGGGPVPSAEQLAERRKQRTAESIKRNRERGMAFDPVSQTMDRIKKGKP